MLLSEVDAHRAEVHGITTLAAEDLSAYAATILTEGPDKVAGQLRVASTAVVSTYGETAAVSGALFYETQRPKPGFTAGMVGPSLGEQLAADLGWAMVPLFTPDLFDAGPAEAVTRLAAVTQKYVADADRGTIAQATRTDRTSRGYRRYANPGACAFCAYLSSASAPVEAEDRTHWHNNCKCVTVPMWDDNPLPHSEVMARYDEAAGAARTYLEQAQYNHPDFPRYSKHRLFLRAHPDLAINTKNITRVMREQSGFAH